jgi:hypothetical protein
MFYDPGDQLPVAAEAAGAPASRLKAITFVSPFPHMHVGIHYWFEDDKGTPLSENRAATVRGRLTLHMRNNVGGGFLTVWSIEGEGGAQLTPMDGQYFGYHMSDLEYVVPGHFEFTSGDGARRLIVVYGRSQSEQAGSPTHARQRLETISNWTGPHGIKVLRESDDATPGQIGTYVVDQDGSPVATEIVLRSR